MMPDEGPRVYITFQDFLEEVRKSVQGFIISRDLLDRYYEREDGGRVIIQGGPFSAGQDLVGGTEQGMLRSLGVIMRRHGYPPVKGTHGVRGYRL